MKIVNQDVHLLKAELCKVLDRCKEQPSTPGLRILKGLLPKDRSLLKQLEYSAKGHYFWLPVHSSPWGEVVLCFWPPKSAQNEANSLKHDHYSRKALVVPLFGEVLHTLHHVRNDTFFIYRRGLAKPLNLLFVPGWQCHSIKNLSDEWAFSLHFYWLCRPAMELELAEE